MGLTRNRRKKALVSGVATCLFLVYALLDTRSDQNLKNYEFYVGNYAKIQIVKQNET